MNKRPAASIAKKVVKKRPAYPKGGGPHKDLKRGKQAFAKARAAAIRSRPTEKIQSIAKVSLRLRLCDVDKTKYHEALTARLGIVPTVIESRCLKHIVSVTYKFPSEAACFQMRRPCDWTQLFCRYNYAVFSMEGISFKWAIDSQHKSTAKVETGQVTLELEMPTRKLELEVPLSSVSIVTRKAQKASKIADAFVHGVPCWGWELEGCCSRRCESGEMLRWCCRKCPRTKGLEHTEECDANQSKVAASYSDVGKISQVERFQLASPPTVDRVFETLLESEKAPAELKAPDLKAIAASVRCDGAAWHGLETVTSEGRFSCEMLGGLRVGCCLCDSGPMVPSCWLQHAASAAHAAKLKASGQQLSAGDTVMAWARGNAVPAGALVALRGEEGRLEVDPVDALMAAYEEARCLQCFASTGED